MDNLDFLGDEEPDAIGVPETDVDAEPEHGHPQGFVPLQAMFDERAKRQAWEQHAAGLQSKLETAARDEPAQDSGDRRMAGLLQQHESLMLDMSERMAAMAHGADMTEAAKQWALEQPPEFRQMVRAQHDPYGYLVRLYSRSQDDFDDYVQWRQARQQIEHNPYSARPQAPPRSQATTPSAGYGRAAYLSDEDAFDGAFTKRG